MPIDPVCGMFVPDSDDAVESVVRGHRYLFCSEGCLRRFTAPERELARFRWLAAAALALGSVLALLIHTDLVAEPTRGLVLLALGTGVQAVAGWPFYRSLARAVTRRAADVDTLVAVGTTAAWAFGAVEVVRPELLVAGAQQYYFEVAALVVGFVLVGRILEHRLRRDASEEARALMERQPETARITRDGEPVEVPLEEVGKGDVFHVHAGDRIPLDGVVTEGDGAVDEKLVTGESAPVDKAPGARVLAGTRLRSGELTVETTRTGGESTVARIVDLMAEAGEASPKIQRLADRVTAWYVPAVVAIAVGSAVAWIVLGGLALPAAFAILLAVLLVGCPCPLGLATPAAVEAGIARGAQRGLLLKGAEFVEVLQQVDMIVFDKTGTLTRGEPTLTDLHAEDLDEDELLALAAAAERDSQHPLARSVVEAVEERGLDVAAPSAFETVAGAGVEATVDGVEVLIGSPGFVAERGIETDAVEDRLADLQAQGKTAIVVCRDGTVAGVLAFEDELRPEAQDAVDRAKALGLDVGLMTGDHGRTARAVGDRLGLGKRRSFAGLTPDDKVALVHALQDGDRVVAMVGEGINDAPAMARADVGIAVGSGADVAVEAADIVLESNDLTAVADAIELGRETRSRIRQNLAWAFLYNAVLIPFAALGFIGPLLAGGLMAFSNLPVAANSVRVRRSHAEPA